MGNNFGFIRYEDSIPDYVPFESEPRFDPQFGFEAPRKERQKPFTEEEMVVMRLPHRKRDYCADHFVTYTACVKATFPFPVFCKHERHSLHDCYKNDQLLRLKEFEREQRLRLREEKINGTQPM